MYPLSVVRQIVVQASWDRCWSCLTAPAALSQWFAATDRLVPGERVVLDFGDGDFFAGRVVRGEPPSLLSLTWRFWDIGPSYDITYLLAPLGHAIEVTVIDSGAGDLEEVDSLREGWEDFLERLKTYAETGKACRYRWSEAIGASCFAEPTLELCGRLADARWWEERFPDARIALRVEARSWRLELDEPGWNGRVTGHLRFDQHLGRPCLKITHAGWTALPSATQVGVRRRYAGLWRDLLAALETEFGSRSEPRQVVGAIS